MLNYINWFGKFEVLYLSYEFDLKVKNLYINEQYKIIQVAFENVDL